MSYFDENEIDGQHICNIDRTSFGAEIVKFANDNKKLRGPSMKLYKALNEFDFTSIIQEAKEDDNDDDDTQIILPSTVEQCTFQQLLYLLKHHTLKDEKLSQHKDAFISYFQENKVDGNTLKAMKRKDFAAAIIKHCSSQQMNGPAMKLFRLITGYNDLTQFNPTPDDNDNDNDNDNDIWSINTPSIIEQCSVEQIIYMTQNSQVFQTTLSPHKDEIIRYLKQNEINGEKFKSIGRREFAHQIATYLDQNSTTLPLGKLWKDIDEYQIPITMLVRSSASEPEPETETETEAEPEPNDILWDSKPQTIAECNIEQLQYILAHYLLTSNSDKFEKLLVYRSKILKFMVTNEYSGSKLVSVSRREFGQELKKYLGDDETLSKTAQLFSALTDFDLNQIPELRKRIITRQKRKLQSPKESAYMPPIDEKAPIIVKQTSKSEQATNHIRSPSAPTISVNGTPLRKSHGHNKYKSSH